jgi:hypothetical protein
MPSDNMASVVLAKLKEAAEGGAAASPEKTEMDQKKEELKAKMEETKSKAKSRFSGWKLKAKEVALEKLQEAQAMAVAKGLVQTEEEEDLAPAAYPPLFWESQLAVGEEGYGLSLAQLKVGVRYYADGGVRAVKRGEGDVHVTWVTPAAEGNEDGPKSGLASVVALAASKANEAANKLLEEEAASATVAAAESSPAAALPSPPSPREGTGELTRAERIALYRRLGFFRAGSHRDREWGSDSKSKVPPEYVHVGIVSEVKHINFSLKSPPQTAELNAPTAAFAVLRIDGPAVRLSVRPSSMKVEGRVNQVELTARIQGQPAATSLLCLQKGPYAPGGALLSFGVDTLADPADPAAAAKANLTVAGLTVSMVPSAARDFRIFFKPADAAAAAATAAAVAAAAAAAAVPPLKLAAMQKKPLPRVRLAVTLLHTMVQLVEAAEFGGAYALFARKIELAPTQAHEAATTRAGDFHTTCDAVEDAVAASAHAVNMLRHKAASCQDFRLNIEELALLHRSVVDNGTAEHASATGFHILQPLSIGVGVTITQMPAAIASDADGPAGYVAITAAVPTMYFEIGAEHTSRMLQAVESLLDILTVPATRQPSTPPPLTNQPEIELGPASRLSLSAWVVADGVEVFVPAMQNGPDADVDGVKLLASQLSLGFLSLVDEEARKATYVCTQAGQLNVAWVPRLGETHQDPILSMKELTGPKAIDVHFFSTNCIDHVEKIVALDVPNVAVTANPVSVRCLQEYWYSFFEHLSKRPRFPKNPQPVALQFIKIDLGDLSLNCQMDARQDSKQGCIKVSTISCSIETSAEPLTSEKILDFGLGVQKVALTMKQDGSDLSLMGLPDEDLQNDIPVVSISYTQTALPPGSTAAPIPKRLSVDVHTLSLWLYPSLIRLAYEVQTLLKTMSTKKPSPTTNTLGTTTLPKTRSPSTYNLFEIQGSISECAALLSVADPSDCGKGSSQLVVGVQIGEAVIPDTSSNASLDCIRTVDLSVQQLKAFTARLGGRGTLMNKTPLIQDIDIKMLFAEFPHGYEIDVVFPIPILARLDSTEATALLALRSLTKLRPRTKSLKTRMSSDSLSSDSVTALDLIQVPHLEEDDSDEEDGLPGVDGQVSTAPAQVADSTPLGGDPAFGTAPPGKKFTRGSFMLPYVRIAMSDTTDVGAIIIGQCSASFSDNQGNISIQNVGISDCCAAERGLLVLGMGEWLDLSEEPGGELLQPVVDDDPVAAAEAAEDAAALHLQWDIVPLEKTPTVHSPSSDLVAQTPDEQAIIFVELKPMQLRATPRFGATCVNWAASVWADRDMDDEEEVVEQLNTDATKTDWVLSSDYCTEQTHGLSAERRLFIEKPAHKLHNTVHFSGGRLLCDTRSKRLRRPVIYLADGVHLVLQDVGVDDLEPHMVSLGVGATVSGSMTLNGTEIIWDGALSTSFRARHKQQRQRRKRNIDAAISAPTIRMSSFHKHGNISFVFGVESKYLVEGQHKRLEIDASGIELSCQREGEEAPVQLLFLDSFKTSYDTTSSSLGTGAVQVNLGRVPVVMSNSIGQAIYWAVSDWLVIYKKAFELIAELKKAEPIESRRARKEAENKRRQEAHMTTFVANLQCPEIQIRALNDTSSEQNGGRQLAARLSVTDISLESTRILVPADEDDEQDKNEQMYRFQFNIFMDIMNPNIAVWEPLLEPVIIESNSVKEGPLQMSVDVKVGRAIPTIVSFTEDAKKGSLEMNVTASMLDIFRQTADCWFGSITKKRPAEVVANYPPDMLRRFTGTAVVSELCGDLTLHNDLTDATLEFKCGGAFLESGEMSVGGDQNALLRLKYGSTENRTIEIWIEGYRSIYVQVDKVMSELKIFSPTGNSPRLSVVSVVEFIGNQKTISIRSLIFTRNHTAGTLYLDTVGGDSDALAGVTVPNDCGYSLPVDAKLARLRPNEMYNWSDPFWQKTYKLHDDVTMLVCQPKTRVTDTGKLNGPWYYFVCNVHTTETSLSLSVFAPVALSNLLPCDMTFQAYGSPTSKSVNHEGTLKPGGVLLLHTIPAEAWIKIRVAGYGWSALHKVTDRPTAAAIALPDGEGRSCNLVAQAEDSEEAGRKLTIFCPFWIVNHTGLRLQYAADDTFAYNLVAGPAASESTVPFMVSLPKIAVRASFKGEGDGGAISTNYETEYSRSFSLTTIGTSGAFSLADKPTNSWRFDIATDIHLGTGTFRRTKVITLRALYTVVNHLEEYLKFRQLEADTETAVSVAPGGSQPLYWPHSQRLQQVVHRISDGQWTWSEAIDVIGSNTNVLRVGRSEAVHGGDHRIVIRKTTIRQGSDLDSDRLGNKKVGQIVTVLESRALESGRERIRCSDGWLSVEATDDQGAFLRPLNAAWISDQRSGYLEKMGEVRKSYKKRWFVLDWPDLSYFEKQGGEKKGSIDMKNCYAVEPGSEPKDKGVLLLHTTGERIYQLKASSEEECQHWIDALHCSLIEREVVERRLRADLQLTRGHSKIVVSNENILEPLYLIQNHTSQITATISQKDVPGVEKVVDPHQSCSWEWPKPVKTQRVVMKLESITSRGALTTKEYSLEKIKEHKPLVVGDLEVVVTVQVRGLTKVCHINTRKSSSSASGTPETTRQRRRSLEELQEVTSAVMSKRLQLGAYYRLQ